MAPAPALKDQLFNAAKVGRLADRFAAADRRFDAGAFSARVMARLPDLELKQRIAWIARALRADLPGPLPEIAPVIRAALPPPLAPDSRDGEFGDFIHAPLGELVVLAGLDDHPDLSLDLIEEITQRFSMEYAIRPFLNRWPDLVLARMQGWTGHPSVHVRRLVSEGTRPRLPWGMAVTLDPARPLPLLDALQDDRARYVTRSVANHLNDIARKSPDLVLDRLTRWRQLGRQRADELDWMTGHALRGLIRDGDTRALRLLGLDPDAPVAVDLDLAETRLSPGDTLRLACRIQGPPGTPVLADFAIHFPRPGGSVRAKLFKLGQATLPAEGHVEMTGRHRLKADATTYRLCPGAHRLDLRVNGRVRVSAEFELAG